MQPESLKSWCLLWAADTLTLVHRVRLYCKGADSMIYARLAAEQEAEQASQPHLAEMAREGLRTLCLGQRDISDREFQVSLVQEQFFFALKHAVWAAVQQAYKPCSVQWP